MQFQRREAECASREGRNVTRFADFGFPRALDEAHSPNFVTVPSPRSGGEGSRRSREAFASSPPRLIDRSGRRMEVSALGPAEALVEPAPLDEFLDTGDLNFDFLDELGLGGAGQWLGEPAPAVSGCDQTSEEAQPRQQQQAANSLKRSAAEIATGSSDSSDDAEAKRRKKCDTERLFGEIWSTVCTKLESLSSSDV